MTNACTPARAVILASAVLLMLVGCTNISIKPVAAEPRIKEVLIQENPKVLVSDFLTVLTDGFKRHGIAVTVIPVSVEPQGAFIVTYQAYRTWDFASYLCDATITLSKDGRKVAQALYHLKGGGGFSLTKWSGSRSKIDPVIDELLKKYPVAH